MTLNNYKSWLTLRYDEFVAGNKPDPNDVDEDVQYGKLTRVTRVRGPNEEFLYFSHDTLRLIYISNEVLAESLWREFKNSFDTKASEKIARSRAGKTSNQLIFASKGFTASIGGDDVDFIEIYTPCSLQDYLDNFYREPGLFIR